MCVDKRLTKSDFRLKDRVFSTHRWRANDNDTVASRDKPNGPDD